jgi:lysophospholipase L1-like esterase|tara:strand:+ start:1770 stop:2537 length:768 start_codon:yes stop_codon:yes gene_type:complete
LNHQYEGGKNGLRGKLKCLKTKLKSLKELKMKMFKILTAATMATVLTGCLIPEPPYTVMVMGDSIMHKQVAEFGTDMQLRDYAPLLFNNAIAGSSLAHNDQQDYWAGRIEASRNRAYDLDVIFISLGTNDGTYYNGNAGQLLIDFPLAIDVIMAKSVGVEVYWQPPSIESEAANVNRIRTMLFAAADLYDNLTIVDVPLGLMSPDGLHLSEAGASVMSQKYLDILGYSTDTDRTGEGAFVDENEDDGDYQDVPPL